MSPMPERHIVALGGGGFTGEDVLLDDYILALTGKPRSKVCFVPTASGDSDFAIVRFYEAFPAERCEASHLGLFRRRVDDLRAFVLSQDVVYVGGGNTATMLAAWRVHGLDAVLREAWEAGVVMCGVSAGALCWFECGVTDSFGPLRRLDDGLGFVAGSVCPHYDTEEQRRPTYRRLVSEGLAPGYAVEEDVGLHFVGSDLAEVVTSRPGALAFRVEKSGDDVLERDLPFRSLP